MAVAFLSSQRSKDPNKQVLQIPLQQCSTIVVENIDIADSATHIVAPVPEKTI